MSERTEHELCKLAEELGHKLAELMGEYVGTHDMPIAMVMGLLEGVKLSLNNVIDERIKREEASENN